ncbi:hypothetical protein D3C78_1120420 [compost metagenome]
MLRLVPPVVVILPVVASFVLLVVVPPKVTLSFVTALSYFTAALSVAACASLTSFNCSSVAARPCVAKSAADKFLLLNPVMSLLALFSTTPPTVTLSKLTSCAVATV